MPKMKLKSAAKREAFRRLEADMLDLKENHKRRFRNAILCLAQCDPRWMTWVDRTLPPHMDEIAADFDTWLMLVEAAARWRVFAAYGYFHNATISHLLFRHDWAFTDRGTLSPG